MKFLGQKQIARITRIAALGIAAGIIAMGAGNALGMDAITSASLGASTVVLTVTAGLALIYAAKGSITNNEFDKVMDQAIQQINAKADDASPVSKDVK